MFGGSKQNKPNVYGHRGSATPIIPQGDQVTSDSHKPATVSPWETNPFRPAPSAYEDIDLIFFLNGQGPDGRPTSAKQTGTDEERWPGITALLARPSDE